MFYIKLNWLIINCVGKKYEKEWSGGRSTAVNIYKKETFQTYDYCMYVGTENHKIGY